MYSPCSWLFPSRPAGGNTSVPSTPASSQPVSSTQDLDEPPEDASSAVDEDVPEEELPEEEPAEEEPTFVTISGGENVLSVNTDQGTLVEFTLPAETPIYDQMIFQEENQNSMLTHGGGVSGKTIVEPYFASTEETPCEEYIDHLAGSTRNNPHDDETFTRDLNGREVVIYKRTENTVNAFGTEVCEFRYLFAVPVIENVVLGFQVSGSYGTDNDLVYDDSVIDILLSHITF